jgi:hypothetical protein
MAFRRQVEQEGGEAAVMRHARMVARPTDTSDEICDLAPNKP